MKILTQDVFWWNEAIEVIEATEAVEVIEAAEVPDGREIDQHVKYKVLFSLKRPMTRFFDTLLDRGITLFEISYTMAKKINDWFLNKLGIKNRFNYFSSKQ